MLTVCPSQRADISYICMHWWVNKGYERNCLEVAEEFATQTPVRLNILLSLVPQTANIDKIVVDNSQKLSSHSLTPNNFMSNSSSAVSVPTKSHSVSSLVELSQYPEKQMNEQKNYKKRSFNIDDMRKFQSFCTDEKQVDLNKKKKNSIKNVKNTDETIIDQCLTK